MNQPGNDVRIDRVNSQRAQSAVLVEKDGVQYAIAIAIAIAIVADDNYNFLDPYWKAMFEAPDFVQLTPFGPPTPIGGSASAKKVALGGKLGIVKDPFGKNGQPQFMGATLPLDGYGIINLSLSKDGKVLIGQLKGGFSANIFDMQQKAHQSHAWNVEQLIAATLAHPEDKRLQKHIKLPNEAEQYITVPTNAAGYTAAPAGTMFNNAPLNVQYTGNMGDVIKVDLAELAAIKLLTEELNVVASALNKAQIDARKLLLKGFSLSVDVLKEFGLTAQLSGDPTAPRLLIATQGAAGSLAPMKDTAAKAFLETGVLYLLPNITNSRLPASSILDARDAQANRFPDIEKLRMGQTLADKFLSFGYGFTDGKYGEGKPEFNRIGQAAVTARDYATAPATFFGDRPLDNPGYSKMTLTAEVKLGSENTLDVLKVEQRLKYLGFPAIGTGNPTRTNNAIQDFSVDGTFGITETAALKLFEKVVRYSVPGGTTRFATNYSDGADGVIEATSQNLQEKLAPTAAELNANQGLKTINWLNAYNTPHWMQFYSSVGTNAQGQPSFVASNAALGTWLNQQTGGNRSEVERRLKAVETFGTSWLYDLMQARALGQAGYVAGLPPAGSWFNGATDANHGYTPGGQSSHDLGMAMDLGLNPYIGVSAQARADAAEFARPVAALIAAADAPYANATGWSDARALALTQALTGLRNGTIQGGQNGNDQANALRDFLSMYAIGQSGSVSRTQALLSVQNGTAEQKATIGDALFGAAGNALIRGALVGSPTANPYSNMHDILQRLGVTKRTWANHENHFHVYLQPPEPVRIITVGTNNLMAQVSGANIAPPQTVAVSGTKLAQSGATGARIKYDRVISTCLATHFDPIAGGGAVGPLPHLEYYLQATPKNRGAQFFLDASKAQVKVLEPFKHGSLRADPNSPGSFLMTRYNPEYFGPDKAVFEVAYEGKLYKFHLRTILSWNDYNSKDDGPCDARLRVIGQSEWTLPHEPAVAENAVPFSWDVLTQRTDLSELIAAASGVLLDFQDLPSTALGQTTGEGTSAQIILDQNAAGHGWYIDTTPLDNTDDYLPTSNPAVWQAKAGSLAAGKMDLLSVLLHEYGHALGLEHSADSSDYMAASLQPGQRKLPSTEELALMARLVADLKTEVQDPTNPLTPSPLSVLGLLPLGLMRRTGSGTAAGIGLHSRQSACSSPKVVLG